MDDYKIPDTAWRSDTSPTWTRVLLPENDALMVALGRMTATHTLAETKLQWLIFGLIGGNQEVLFQLTGGSRLEALANKLGDIAELVVTGGPLTEIRDIVKEGRRLKNARDSWSHSIYSVDGAIRRRVKPKSDWEKADPAEAEAIAEGLRVLVERVLNVGWSLGGRKWDGTVFSIAGSPE